jgi:predicted small lipoprotein YifL
LTPLFRAPRTLIVFASLSLLAAGLSSCGRRGPVELPPDVQARGQALKAAEEARAKDLPNSTRAKPAPGADESRQPEPAIPGTIGHRPPEQYPFPLDPLL